MSLSFGKMTTWPLSAFLALQCAPVNAMPVSTRCQFDAASTRRGHESLSTMMNVRH